MEAINDRGQRTDDKWQMTPGHYSLLTRHPPLAIRHLLFTTRHCVSTAMGTVGIVQAAFGNQEIIEDFSSQDRFGDDPGYVFGGDPAIPDTQGIDHDGRSVLALVEAARMIGPGQGPESGLPELELEGILERLEARRVAATPLVARVANVTADENVVREGRHVSSHETWLKSAATGQGKTLRRNGTVTDRIASARIPRQSLSRPREARVRVSGRKFPRVNGPSIRICTPVILTELKAKQAARPERGCREFLSEP